MALMQSPSRLSYIFAISRRLERWNCLCHFFYRCSVQVFRPCQNPFLQRICLKHRRQCACLVGLHVVKLRCSGSIDVAKSEAVLLVIDSSSFMTGLCDFATRQSLEKRKRCWYSNLCVLLQSSCCRLSLQLPVQDWQGPGRSESEAVICV
jgi:hypothetical protein